MLNYKKIFLWSALFMSVYSGEIAVAQPNVAAPALFSDAKGMRPKVAPGNDYIDKRYNYVRVNMGVLFDKNWTPKGLDKLKEIRFDLFPGVSFVGIVTQRDANSAMGFETWGGDLKSMEGEFSITAAKDGILLTIHALEKGTFNVNCDATYFCKVVEVDISKLPMD